MLDQAAQRARELFDGEVFYCAEAVLMAMAEHLGVESDLIPQIATGFCSGIARTSGQCGAVSGAMMGIGLANGVREPGGDRSSNYTAVRKLLDEFKKQFGSTNCRELTGCDLDTLEGQEKFYVEGKFNRCLDYVETATRVALSTLQDDE